MDIEIGTNTDLNFEQAKDEYRRLSVLLNCKVFPDGGTGWSVGILNKIHDRMDFLKTKIADEVTNGRL